MTARQKISRRKFLTHAAGAAAVVACPYVLTSAALGAPGRLPASERITLGFIGLGKQGNYHYGAMLGRGDVQVLAACDVEAKRLAICKHQAEERYSKQVGGTYKGCDAYHDFRELLARPDIDAVVICTPDHWHAIPVIQACQAGKDIYCEKPLSLTIREARAMVDATRRYSRVFQTGSMQRSEYSFRFGCEMVRSGRIGKVHTVYVNVGGPSQECYLPPEPVFEGLDWDFWLGPAPSRPFNAILCPNHTETFPNWRGYRDYSGGGMTDWGAHHFDIAQWGLGMDESGPVEIIPPDGKDVKRLTYKYANGVVMYHGGAAGRAGAEFVGPKGRVLVNRGYLETDPPSLLREPLGPDEVHLYNSSDHRSDWLQCVRARRRPICDVEVGCRSVTVCHLGNIAYWLNRPLKWDPVKEEILGDAEASRWLDRAKRAPWHM